jgi:hypothetical protein
MTYGSRQTAERTRGQPDDAYKDAVSTYVDDHMRSDVLGPHFCRVLREHKPVSEDIVALLTKEMAKDPGLMKAIECVVENLDTKRKSRWIDRAVGAGGTVLVGVIGGLLVYGLTHFPTSQPQTSTPSAATQRQPTTPLAVPQQ